MSVCGLQHAYGEEWGVSLIPMTRGQPWSCMLSCASHALMETPHEHLPLFQVGAQGWCGDSWHIKSSSTSIIPDCLATKANLLTCDPGSRKSTGFYDMLKCQDLASLCVSLSMWWWLHSFM